MAAPVFLHFITTSSSLVLAGTLLEAMRRGKSQRGEAGQTCVSTQIAYGHAESTQRRHNYSGVNFLHICLVEVERCEHWCCLLIRSLQETRDSLWHVVSSFIISLYLAGSSKKKIIFRRISSTNETANIGCALFKEQGGTWHIDKTDKRASAGQSGQEGMFVTCSSQWRRETWCSSQSRKVYIPSSFLQLWKHTTLHHRPVRPSPVSPKPSFTLCQCVHLS